MVGAEAVYLMPRNVTISAILPPHGDHVGAGPLEHPARSARCWQGDLPDCGCDAFAVPSPRPATWTAQGDEDNPLLVNPSPHAILAGELHDLKLDVANHDGSISRDPSASD